MSLNNTCAVLEITQDNFQKTVLENDMPFLVEFHAEWCNLCDLVAPVVDQIAKERCNTLSVGKLDIVAHSAIAERYNVRGIPFVGLFHNGELTRSAVGVRPKEELERSLGL
jgi:thioredoxin 1